MNGLAGKRVVITGGTSGIGAAAAQRFRDEGCEVVILARRSGAGRDRAATSATASRSRRPSSRSATSTCSSTTPASACAAPPSTSAPTSGSRSSRTNLSGAFWVAQAAARRMLLGRGGVILFTASTNALVGYRYYADYNATKAGLVALTKSLALEWAPTVRVNAVCPGYVLTPMQEAEYTPEMLDEVNRAHPARASRDARGARRPLRLPGRATRPPTSPAR